MHSLSSSHGCMNVILIGRRVVSVTADDRCVTRLRQSRRPRCRIGSSWSLRYASSSGLDRLKSFSFSGCLFYDLNRFICPVLSAELMVKEWRWGSGGKLMISVWHRVLKAPVIISARKKTSSSVEIERESECRLCVDCPVGAASNDWIKIGHSLQFATSLLLTVDKIISRAC